MNKLHRRDYLLSLFLFIIIFIFFLNFLHVPEYKSFRDEGQFFYGAERILNGQSIYRDFHEIQFPGSFYLLAGAFSLFGSRFETGRVLTYLSIACALVIYFFILRTISTSLFYSVMPVFIIAFFGFTLWPGSIPHWFSFFTNCASIFFIYIFIGRQQKLFLLSAGIFAGFSLTIVQNEGIFLFLGILSFLFFFYKYQREKFKEFLTSVLFFSVPFISIAVLVIIFFLVEGGLKEFFSSTFLFLFEHYLPSNKIPSFGYFTKIIVKDLLLKIGVFKGAAGVLFKVYVYIIILLIYFIQYGLIIVYSVSLIQLIKNFIKDRMNFYHLYRLFFTIVGIMLFLSQIHKPDPVRLMFVSMPAFILLMNFLEGIQGKTKIAIYIVLTLLYLVILTYSTLMVYDKRINFNCSVTAPGGIIYFQDERVCLELNQLQNFFYQIPEKEKEVYIHNWAVQYYFLFKLKNPVHVDGFLMGHNSVKQYEDSLKILTTAPPLYILTDNVLDFILNNPNKSPFPTLDLDLLKKDPIWEFIRANYREIAFLPASGLTLWKRRGGGF